MKLLAVWNEEREKGISNMSGLLKFITCGSVDDGKSTLIGHILYDSKLLYTDQEKALELDSKVGSRGGEIDYSLLLDGLMAEREQGITIDVAYRYFTTEKRSFIVADTPGHEEYTRNMAVGASFADLAVILIDAKQGVLVQTRRHARICELMGIKYFVFAVNKMDLVDYSEERFHEIEAQIKELSEELSLANVKIIPVSATEGDNVTTKSDNIKWYDGEALLTYLENIDISEDDHEVGFYMPVQRVCRPDHTFRGFQGQVEDGEIHVGDELTTLPSNETAKVKSIYVGDKQSDNPVLPCRRDDDCEEHAVKGNAQCTDSPQRQQIARNDAQRCTDGPSRCRQQNGTVGIIWIQAAGPCNGDAEQLVRHVVTDEQAVAHRRAGREFLAERTAHQQIARVGDERHHRDFQIGCVGRDGGETRVFARGSIVEQAGHEALQGCKARRPGRDAQRERHRKIPQRDRHTVPHPFAEHLAAESVGLGGLCGAEGLSRRLMRCFHEKSSFPISNTNPIIA